MKSKKLKLLFFRYKEMATYKIDALQKSLAESIPSSTLDEANRQYTELTMKYRDLLQNENTRNAQVLNNFYLSAISVHKLLELFMTEKKCL